MAKKIKYKFLSCEVNRGTEESPNNEQVFSNVAIEWNETNEEIAKREAYNGEYTIEDDGAEDSVVATTEERISALEEAMLEVLGVVLND